MIKITEQHIRDAIGYGSIQKGYEYFKRNRVQEYSVDDTNSNYVILQSRVSGNYQNFYNQSIKLDRRGNKLKIEGGCSCPVGYNCKHVVAACLQYAHDIKTTTPQYAINKWIDSLIKNTQKDILVSHYTNSEYFLIYRLFEEENRHYKDDIKFYKAKKLNNGSVGKGTVLSSDNLLYSSGYHDILDYDDRDILELCKGFIPKWSNESTTLKGELCFLILKKIVETKRAYYKNEKTPLEFSNEKKTIDLQWVQTSTTTNKLVSNLTSEYKLIDTKPALVLDTTTSIFFELDSSYDVAFLNTLDTIPDIPNESIAEIFETINKVVPNISLPAPKEIEQKTIKTTPIAFLELFRVEQGGSKFHTMRLDFAYENYLVKHFPNNQKFSFLEKDKFIEIIRNLDFELQAKQRLEKLGFTVEIQDNSLLFLSLAQNSMQDAIARWGEFLDTHIAQLELAGWDVRFDESFTMQFESNSNISINTDKQDTNDWFNLSFDIEFGGVARPLLNLITPLLEEFEEFELMPELLNIEVEDNHFLQVEKQEIEPILKTIMALYDKKEKNNILKISPFEAHLIEDMDENIIWRGSKELQELSKKLKNYKGLENVTLPKVLNATLREYQQEGVNWLRFLHEFRFGGILADDMGLGKTIQTLTHLCCLKEEKKLTKPSLIIMPTSLIANWKNEAKKFTPNLSVLSLHGADRFERFESIEKHDIVLSTYPLIVRDFEKLSQIDFCYIILDEAQKIKNPKTKMTQSIKQLKSEYRLTLSGTPVENHLGELWSIFSFLMPGFLDTQSFFKNFYQTPIEKENDTSRNELLNKKIRPFMLRRTKELVASELPPKSIILKYTQFDTKQAKLYEAIRVTMEKKVRDTISKKGLGGSHITILDALLKLRQVCCDPSLLSIKEAKKVKESAKLELLLDLVDELLQENKKILLFSQFTSMLSIIEEKLLEKKISYTKLTGSTVKREEAIEEFRSGKKDIFLISLKAGGVGLNLVEADTVIHYDPWWNPAVENQATDRAYRIGQTKAVFVYKLIVENSIEEKIIELQEKKQALQDGVFDGKKDDKDIFQGSELLELLK